MLLLSTTALPSLSDHPDPDTGAEIHEGLGRLLTPRHYSSVEKTGWRRIPWAADNDGYNGVDEVQFVKMLDRIAGVPGCRFVSVPDVIRCDGFIDKATKQKVDGCGRTMDGYGEADGIGCQCKAQGIETTLRFGDAALTRRRFAEWAPQIAERGLPCALVLQDGQDAAGVDWELVDAVFVGGSTEFKLGEEAARWCRAAKARGKWVHWGRVNSRKRMAHCIGTGAADSCDGTKWAMFRKTHLDNGLRWCRELTFAGGEAAVAA